jgi:hypothetical protein
LGKQLKAEALNSNRHQMEITLFQVWERLLTLKFKEGEHAGSSLQPHAGFCRGNVALNLVSVHPETALKIPKLKLWTPKNGHLGVQSFSFGSVSGWTLSSVHPETALKIPKLKLWTPKNGPLVVQSFSFGSVSGWTLVSDKK